MSLHFCDISFFEIVENPRSENPRSENHRSEKQKIHSYNHFYKLVGKGLSHIISL